MIAQAALSAGAEWVFWLDDDLTFPPNVLFKLLAHQKPCVVGLSLRRRDPFNPLWWTGQRRPTPTTLELDFVTDLEVGENGLKQLAGATSGGLLTHRSVLEAIEPPWWTLGQFISDQWCDDVAFCDAVLSAGFTIWGDPQTRFGHMTNIELWPHHEDGAWSKLLVRGAEPFAAMPLFSPPD